MTLSWSQSGKAAPTSNDSDPESSRDIAGPEERAIGVNRMNAPQMDGLMQGSNYLDTSSHLCEDCKRRGICEWCNSQTKGVNRMNAPHMDGLMQGSNYLDTSSHLCEDCKRR